MFLFQIREVKFFRRDKIYGIASKNNKSNKLILYIFYIECRTMWIEFFALQFTLDTLSRKERMISMTNKFLITLIKFVKGTTT